MQKQSNVAARGYSIPSARGSVNTFENRGREASTFIDEATLPVAVRCRHSELMTQSPTALGNAVGDVLVNLTMLMPTVVQVYRIRGNLQS